MYDSNKTYDITAYTPKGEENHYANVHILEKSDNMIKFTNSSKKTFTLFNFAIVITENSDDSRKK